MPSTFTLSAQAQSAAYVVWRVVDSSGETLIDWQQVEHFSISDPSGHAAFDASVTVPGSGERTVVVEVGMRSEPSGDTTHVDRRQLHIQ